MALAEPLHDALPEAPPTAADVAGGPYKFLDYYADTPEDRRRFAGREREVRELGVRIANEATLVLYGRSGLGKTSLLLAGVFPELRDRGYRPVYVRTLTTPLDDLKRAVAREYGWGDSTPEESLRELVARAAAVQPPILVLDQFEEFFIRFRDRPEPRAAFIAAVAEVVLDETLDAPVVFSLREDYLAELDDFRELLPDLFANEYRLRPLTAFGVRQAILRPLIDRGIGYEDAVVSKLVDQIEGFGFDPPVLQILCSELYKEAATRAGAATPRITLLDLEHVGGLEGIFRRYLDGVARAIPEERHLLARIVLDALITRDDTKQAATLGDLLDARFSAEAKPVETILETLAERRLVRRERRDGEWWYELIHERLVPIVKEWLDLDRRFLDFRQARTYVRNNSESELWRRNPEILLNAGILTDLLAPYRDTFRFTERELEFVLRSAVYRRVDDVKAWADRFGARETVVVLEELARSERDGERLGVAAAAARVEEVDGRLADVCLRMALDDPSEPVRRAAGRSLGKLARPEDLTALDLARRNRGTRGRAREALADLRLGGHRLQGFSWLQRQMARRRAERRLVFEQKAAVRDRWSTGLLSGLLGGLTWVASVGFVLVSLLTALNGKIASYTEWIGSSIMAASLILPLGALLGLLFGWASAAAAAKDAAIHGEGRWLRAVLRGPGFIGCILGLAVVVFLLVFAGNQEQVRSNVFGYVGVTLVLAALGAVWIALLARLLRPCLWPGVSPAGLWLWSLIGSAGIPLLAGVAVCVAAWTAVPEIQSDGGLFFLQFFLLLTTFAACVVALALARSSETHPLGALPPVSARRRRCYRAAAVAALLVLVAGFELTFGRDALPLFAFERTLTLDAERLSHGASLLAGLPDAHYFQIRNRSGDPRLARITSSAGSSGVWLGEAAGYLSNGSILLIPPGRHLASFFSGISEGNGSRRYYIILKPLAARKDRTGIVLRPGEEQVLAPALRPLGQEGWKLELSGSIEGLPADESYHSVSATALFEAPPVLDGSDAVAQMPGGPARVITVHAAPSQLLQKPASEQLEVWERGDGSWSIEAWIHPVDAGWHSVSDLRTPPLIFVVISLEPSLEPETYDYFSQEPLLEEDPGFEAAPVESDPEAP